MVGAPPAVREDEALAVRSEELVATVESVGCEDGERTGRRGEEVLNCRADQPSVGPNRATRCLVDVLRGGDGLVAPDARGEEPGWIAGLVAVVEQEPEEELLVAPVLGRWQQAEVVDVGVLLGGGLRWWCCCRWRLGSAVAVAHERAAGAVAHIIRTAPALGEGHALLVDDRRVEAVGRVREGERSWAAAWVQAADGRGNLHQGVRRQEVVDHGEGVELELGEDGVSEPRRGHWARPGETIPSSTFKMNSSPALAS